MDTDHPKSDCELPEIDLHTYEPGWDEIENPIVSLPKNVTPTNAPHIRLS